MEQETQTPHKRRVRYKGNIHANLKKNIRNLIRRNIRTQSSMLSAKEYACWNAYSIMVNEILDFLKIQPGETGFDATLGYGGHTKAMMECLHGEGHMYATDVDPEESAKTRKRLAEQGFGEDILTVKLQNFCTIDEIRKGSRRF